MDNKKFSRYGDFFFLEGECLSRDGSKSRPPSARPERRYQLVTTLSYVDF